MQELKQLMTLHGGRFENYYHKSIVTHVVCDNLPDTKLKQLLKSKSATPIVHSAWIVESIAAGKLLPPSQFPINRLAINHAQQRLVPAAPLQHAELAKSTIFPQLAAAPSHGAAVGTQPLEPGAKQARRDLANTVMPGAAPCLPSQTHITPVQPIQPRAPAQPAPAAIVEFPGFDSALLAARERAQTPPSPARTADALSTLPQADACEPDAARSATAPAQADCAIDRSAQPILALSAQQCQPMTNRSVACAPSCSTGPDSAQLGPQAAHTASAHLHSTASAAPEQGIAKSGGPRSGKHDAGLSSQDLPLSDDSDTLPEDEPTAHSAQPARSALPAVGQGTARTTWTPAQLAAANKTAAAMRAACDVLKGAPKSSADDKDFMKTYFRASRLHFIGTWRMRIEALMQRTHGSSAAGQASAAAAALFAGPAPKRQKTERYAPLGCAAEE